MQRKILITGSNKGLGYELARVLLASAPEFEKIIITSRNLQLGLRAKDQLGKSNRLDYHILDVTSQDSITSARDYIASTYGSLDVLVNNAAILQKPKVNQHQFINPLLQTNFYGLKNMTEAFLPLMEPAGHIINVSSELGKTKYLNNPTLGQRFLQPDMTMENVLELAEEFKNLGPDWAEKGWNLDDYGIYNVTKALVNSFTRVVARDLAAKGSRVRVNAVHPGWVKTDMGGEIAPLSIEKGGVMPTMISRDTSKITGKFWANRNSEDFS